MIQLDILGGTAGSDYETVVASDNPATSSEIFTQTQGQAGRPNLQSPPQLQQRASSFPPVPGVGAVVHWKTAFPQQHHNPPVGGLTTNSDDDDDDDEYRPFTPPPPRERLSYTLYQLQMMNGIYQAVRYPNSTQKQLIAKRVGITREQVKIWFQNRRRKDVVTSVGKSKSISIEDKNLACAESNIFQAGHSGYSNCTSDTTKEVTNDNGDTELNCSNYDIVFVNPASISSTNSGGSGFDNENNRATNGSSCDVNSNVDVSSKAATPTTLKSTAPPSANLVSQTILDSLIAELNKFGNEYLKLKKIKKKKNKSKSSRYASSASSSLSSCRSERLFQNYDMKAPPNKVTPTAFLNTTANKFKHASGTSAFQNPRESRLPITTNDSRLWEGFALNPLVPGIMETPDLAQQRCSSDLVHSTFTSAHNYSTSSNQSQISNFLSGREGISSSVPTSQSSLYDSLPVLSDLLGNYKNHPPSATALAAAAAATAAAQRKQDHPLLFSATSCPSGTNIPGVYFHLPGGSSSSNNIHGDCGKSLGSGNLFPRSASLSFHHNPQASILTMNRIYPFPLVADPPVMLSSTLQSETFRHPSHWPHSASATSSFRQGSALGIHGNTAPSSLPEDHYRPLMISSLTNPYFTPASSAYSVTSSHLPSQSSPWSLQPQTGSDASSNNFTQL